MKTNINYFDDCFNVLKNIPDGSIDLICTDPPYLTTDLDFDKQDLDFNLIACEFKRVLKKNGWAFVFLPPELIFPFLQNGFRRKFEYIWIKDKPVMQTHNTIKPMSVHEHCFAFIHSELKKPTELTFNKNEIKTKGNSYIRKQDNKNFSEYESKTRIKAENGRYDFINDGWRFPTTTLFGSSKGCMKFSERTDHPTQKPLSIIETIVKGYSNEKDIILDPFSGSGTTAIACIRTNRKYIICENNKEYYDIQTKRIQDEIDKTALFN